MSEAINFVKGLKVFNGNVEVTGRMKCLKGWAVWNHLSANHDFKYILTRRLNIFLKKKVFFGTKAAGGGTMITQHQCNL